MGIKKKFLAGEMYDLTASSTIGLEGFETGKLKNEYGLIDGISESLYKYKKELEIILKDETDDKFAKRMDIRDMIDYCITCDENIRKMITKEEFDKQLTGWTTIKKEPPSFDELFKFTTNYLNGGNGTNQFDKQCLIVTVAGGNPIKIFFQILAYLYNKGQSVNIDDLITKFYKRINDDEHASEKATLIKILTNLKNFLNLTLSEDEIKSIKGEDLNTQATDLDFSSSLLKMDLDKRITADLKFSDMDFAILPNLESILDSYISKQEEEQLGGVGSPKKQKTAKVSPEVSQIPQPQPAPPPRSKRARVTPTETFQQTQEREKAKKDAEKEVAAKKRKEAEKEAAKKRKEAEKEAAKEGEKEAKRTKKEAKKTKPPPQARPPPKGPGSASSQAGPSGEPKEKKSHGFLLVRLKSSNQFFEPYEGLTPNIKSILIEMNRLSKMIDHFPPSKKEQACANKSDLKKLGRTLLTLAQPQLFRQSYLKVDELSPDCKTFLQYKKEEKNLIGSLTSMNITLFVDYLSKDSQDPADRLEVFMDFLHANGKRQNVLIETLSKSLKYASKEEVIKNFESIEEICDTTKPLFEIMSELVLEFSQRPQVNAVMKKITQNLNQDVNSKNIDPTKNTSFKSKTCFYSGVYLAQHLANKLDIKNKLHTINDAPPGLYKLPNNSKITTNPTYKPTNLESKRIKTDDELAEEKALEDEIDNYIAAGIIDDELEQEIEEELIPGLSKLSIGEGRKRHKTRKKRNKKSKKKTRKKRKKKNKISRRKKYTKKNKKG